jgi:hypothetical protein
MSQEYGCRFVGFADFQVARFKRSRRVDRARLRGLDLSRILTVEVREAAGLEILVEPGFVPCGHLLIRAHETPATVKTDASVGFLQISTTAALAPARTGSVHTPIHGSGLNKGKEVRT